MKRKVMLIGLAMASGLPHAVGADAGNALQAYSSWNTPYMPHYGAAGAARPLMDHVSVAGGGASGIGNTWRLEFTPLPAVSDADDPVTARDIRAGFSLKLDF
jgi:hypothetical protein